MSFKISEQLRIVVADAIAEAIGNDSYDCTRVWSAWSYGTMGQDDFVAIVEDQDRINEIADAAIKAVQKLLEEQTGKDGE